MKLTKETSLFALYILSIIIAVCILLDAISKNPGWAWFSLVFLCFSAWISYYIKLDNTQNLYRKIAWIAEKNVPDRFSGRSVSLRDFKLIEYIEDAQQKQDIPEQFRIDFLNEAEKNNLIKILDSHKEHVITYYFCDWLLKSKKIYELSNLDYYFFSLNCFLCDKHDSNSYSDRKYISEHQYKCQLTEYGKVYYKLRLITQFYIENNEQVKNLYNYIDKDSKNHIIEALEKNEVQFFNYRP